MKYASVPPPHKWEFYEQEFITCLGTPFEERVGLVWVVGRDLLTVSFLMGDVIDIPWANARKIHIQGDFVHVSHGLHQGRSGWVVSGVDGYKLCCAEEVLQPPEFKTLIVEVHFQQFEGFTYIQAIIASSHFRFMSTVHTGCLYYSSTTLANWAPLMIS